MKLRWTLPTAALALATAATATLLQAAPVPSAPTKNRSLAINPSATSEVWVVNKENEAVVVMNRETGAVLATVSVGVSPRNIAFNAAGTKAYVTNQRGNVALDKTFLEYTGSEILGSVTVIDTATRQVVKTITAGIGVEPFGVALAPNGKYLLVTNFRSSSLSVIDPASDTVVAGLQYDANLNYVPAGKTVADLDTNGDMLADLDGPRALAIAASSDRAYVTHLKSGFISVVSLALNGSGVPTSLSVAKRINLNKYPFDAFNNPVKITEAKSQGVTRFLDDIAITPDGKKAWLPHELLNVNHDVNFNFLPGAFANRIYGAVSIVDLQTETFQYGDPGKTDASDRLNFDWALAGTPTVAVAFGFASGNQLRVQPTLRASAAPALGTSVDLVLEHGAPNTPYQILMGRREDNVPVGGTGVLYLQTTGVYASGNLDSAGKATIPYAIPSDNSLAGQAVLFQAVVGTTGPVRYSNGLKLVLGPASGAVQPGAMLRIAQPSKVEISEDGRRALVLSRGSEDVTVFDVTGAKPVWMNITPRRDNPLPSTQLDKNHTPFDAARVIGDRPTGLLLAELDVRNDVANAYVNAEASRDLSILKANLTTGVVFNPSGTLKNYVAPASDKFTASERIGAEIFTDGSRTQTTGMFAATCESCHYEGGEDGNVWQRPNGPRSTIPMYGGIRRTGLLLWKAVRMNVGETGPMFAGENGGTGIFNDAEQEGLVAYAEKLPVPLNPNLVNAQLSADAKFGRDLFLGLDDTGLNPTFRSSNCQSCHIVQTPSGAPAWFTNDVIKIFDPNFDAAHQDPCILLKDSFMGEAMQAVNSGVNTLDDQGQLVVDRNGDGIPDLESYAPMNADGSGDFTRDDPNSAQCEDPGNPGNPLVFGRSADKFDVPTKMGVFFTGPYFHDHAVPSLRSTIDPLSQPAQFPLLNKLRNTQHDVRGSNVQAFLASTNVNDDIDVILKFIESL